MSEHEHERDEKAQEDVDDIELAESDAEEVKGGRGFPDVSKTPSPGGPVPIPYPNRS